MRSFIVTVLVGFLVLGGEAKFFKSNKQTLANYVPEPLKAQMPKQIMNDLSKLTLKDLSVSLFY